MGKEFRIVLTPRVRSVVRYLLLAAIVLALGPQLARAAAVGEFTVVKGRVGLYKGGKDARVPAKVGDGVSVGDIIQTKARSRAEMTFSDGSRVIVAEKSRLEVKEFLFKPAKKVRSSVIRSFRGKLRAIVPKIFTGKGSRFEVHTPTTVAAVRGTDFIIIIRPVLKDGKQVSTATDVLSTDGVVGVRNINLRGVGEILLRVGQITKVASNKIPSKPRSFTPKEEAEALAGAEEKRKPQGIDEGGPDESTLSPVPGGVSPLNEKPMEAGMLAQTPDDGAIAQCTGAQALARQAEQEWQSAKEIVKKTKKAGKRKKAAKAEKERARERLTEAEASKGSAAKALAACMEECQAAKASTTAGDATYADGTGCVEIPAEPGYFTTARVGRLARVHKDGKFVVEVYGTAASTDFDRAWVELGFGEEPRRWSRIGQDITKEVTDGLLVIIKGGELKKKGKWTVRLVVKTKGHGKKEARGSLDIE